MLDRLFKIATSQSPQTTASTIARRAVRGTRGGCRRSLRRALSSCLRIRNSEFETSVRPGRVARIFVLVGRRFYSETQNCCLFRRFFLFGFLLAADIVTAQTVAYRQANLASNLSNVANNVTPGLADPWGIAFLPGQPFFLAENNVGR